MNLPDPEQTCADTMHPSPEQLRAFAFGELNDDSSEEIEQHLSGCVLCCEILDTGAEDPLAVLFREIGSMGVSTEMAAPSSAATRHRLAPPGYELLEQLGEGGMGMVSKARRSHSTAWSPSSIFARLGPLLPKP
jgi:hypothetical protein